MRIDDSELSKPIYGPHGAIRTAARPLETAVHHAADAHVATMKVAIQYGFAMGRRAIDHEALRSARTLPEIQAAVHGIPEAVRAALLDVLVAPLKATLDAGGQAGLTILRPLLKAAEGFRALKPQVKGEPHSEVGPFGLAFNLSDENAIQWAEDHAAELAKGLSDTTRDDIADAVSRALDEGDLDRLYEDVLDAVGDDDRAELIAHHETMLSASEGQRQGWDQAVEKGLLSEKAQRVWIATADQHVCPICESLDQTTTDLDGVYTDLDGETYDGPPSHVSCRCSEGITGDENDSVEGN